MRLRAAALAAWLLLAPAGFAWAKGLPPDVQRQVARWWRHEGYPGRPKAEPETLRSGRYQFLRVLIDDPRFRGATGNATYLYFLRTRSGWRFLMEDVGIGAHTRPRGPGGYPWIETLSHSSAAEAGYVLWGWDARTRRYKVWKEWTGPYPRRRGFVMPPGGLSVMRNP